MRLPDIVSKYSVMNQVAIYVALDYVDQKLGSVMPQNDFLPFAQDMGILWERLSEKTSLDQYKRLVELLNEDLQGVFLKVDEIKERFMPDKASQPAQQTIERIMGYIVLHQSLTEILERFHSMKETEIDALLKDTKMYDGLLGFPKIDTMTTEIARNLISKLTESIDQFGNDGN